MKLPYTPGDRKPDNDPLWKVPGLDDSEPWQYIPDPGLVDAANVALMLGKPLLLTGEPGCGKTVFASSLAWELKFPPPLKFETKSDSLARDLFYNFDTLGMFQAAYLPRPVGGAVNPADYLSYNALGESILRSAPLEIDHPLKKAWPHEQGQGTVVLIDEVDKAPRDFPNDLLNELERMFFKVPQLNQPDRTCKVQAPEDQRPVVVLTSNAEKQLPPAFLRRCVYYHLPFPNFDEDNRLARIVSRRVGRYRGRFAPDQTSIESDAALLRQGLEVFFTLREERLSKKPSTGELIDWLGIMLGMGADPNKPAPREMIEKTLSALIKNKVDRTKAQNALWPDEQGA